jgi:valyl-tRNA synthetase
VLPQWFVACGSFGERAGGDVRAGKMELLPVRYQREWQRWMGACLFRVPWVALNAGGYLCRESSFIRDG